MNLYQAALQLRIDYAHTGIELGASEDAYTNLYFVHHDALHTFLSCPPQLEYEPIVLSAELLLGGKDLLPGVDVDEVANRLGSIPTEVLELLINFYTGWFAQ